MKTFKVTLDYVASVTHEIEADNIEDAVKKAKYLSFDDGESWCHGEPLDGWIVEDEEGHESCHLGTSKFSVL